MSTSKVWSDDLSKELQHSIKTIQNRTPQPGQTPATLDVPRVSQWDASMLDDEIMDLLKTQLWSALRFLPNSERLLSNREPELMAFLRLVLWTFTIRLNEPTAGLSLQNLRFRNESIYDGPAHLSGLLRIPGDAPSRSQRLLYGLATVLGPLAWERLRERAVMEHWSATEEEGWKAQVWQLSQKLHKVWRFAAVINTASFLVFGRYRTLLERALRMRLVHDRLDAVRALSFDYINQQLLFDGFSEVLTCFLPLINWFAMKRMALRASLYVGVFMKRFRVFVLTRMLPAWHALKKRVLKSQTGEEDEEGKRLQAHGLKDGVSAKEGTTTTEESKGKDLTDVDDNADVAKSCPMCQGEEVTMPHSLNCGHVYCYLCVQKLARVETLFTCLVCETLVTEVKRIG